MVKAGLQVIQWMIFECQWQILALFGIRVKHGKAILKQLIFESLPHADKENF